MQKPNTLAMMGFATTVEMYYLDWRDEMMDGISMLVYCQFWQDELNRAVEEEMQRLEALGLRERQ